MGRYAPDPALRSSATGETIILGIESSCDETAAAIVVRDAQGHGRIASNVVRSQWEKHRAFGGVVPEIAARAHVECMDDIIAEAMREARVGFADLNGVAAAAGPGLIGGLIIGLITAKAVALAHNKPLIAVNHLEAHALTVGLTKGLKPPYLLLLVSGGHTQLLQVRGLDDYRRLGTTIDDALGEAFDKTAKLLGLDQPGGPAVERAAANGDPKRFNLPRPMRGRSEPHFSFAGLKTAVRQQANAIAPLKDQDIADLCASFEAAVMDTVSDRCARSLDILEQEATSAPGGDGPSSNHRHLVVAGGVAANKKLRAGLEDLAQKRGVELHAPPITLCGDNAAMVAWAGAERLVQGLTNDLQIAARPRWPLDDTAGTMIGSGRKGAKA